MLHLGNLSSHLLLLLLLHLLHHHVLVLHRRRLSDVYSRLHIVVSMFCLVLRGSAIPAVVHLVKASEDVS